MEDFPIWVKAIIWLTMGSVVIYALVAIVYYSLFS
jgi:hypothetical protein